MPIELLEVRITVIMITALLIFSSSLQHALNNAKNNKFTQNDAVIVRDA